MFVTSIFLACIQKLQNKNDWIWKKNHSILEETDVIKGKKFKYLAIVVEIALAKDTNVLAMSTTMS